MKKIVSLLLLSTLALFAANRAAIIAYEEGKIYASKIKKDTHNTVRVKKCKHYVALDKSIAVENRLDGYRGCEDAIFDYKKQN